MTAVQTRARLTRFREPLRPGPDDLARRVEFVGLDAFRMIGALLVSMGHLFTTDQLIEGPLAIRSQHQIGTTFGLMFFPLSGFLLFRPFVAAILDQRALPAAKRFWYRRFWRIFPAYWVAITFLVLFDSQINRPSTFGGWIALYLLVYPYTAAGSRIGLGQVWTLCAEVAFYALLPIIAMGISKIAQRRSTVAARHAMVLYALGGILVAWLPLRYLCATLGTNYLAPTFFVNISGYNYVDWFLVGMALATVREGWVRGLALPKWMEPMVEHPWWAWTVAFGVQVLALTLHVPIMSITTQPTIFQYWLRLVLFAATAGLLMLPFSIRANPPGRLAAALKSPRVEKLSKITYGFYLWHFGAIHLVEHYLDPPESLFGLVLRWFLVLTLSFIAGKLSYDFVEHPITKWAYGRLTNRQANKPDTPEPTTKTPPPETVGRQEATT